MTKKSFQDIFKLMQEQDVRNGTFIFSKFKPTMKNIFTRACFTIALVLELGFGYSCILSKDLLLIILQSIVFAIYSFLIAYLITMKVKNEDTHKMFGFCHEMYNFEKKFHKKVRDIAMKHVNVAYDRAQFLIKWTVIIFYIDPIFMTLGTAIIGHFLPDNIYPRYRLPTPFTFIFFKNQETPFAFYFTIFGQLICALELSTMGAMFALTILVIIFHVFAYIDIINDIIEIMNQEMKSSTKQKLNVNTYKRHPLPSNSKKLGKNTGSSNMTSDFELEFWIKMIVDMVSNISDVMTSFGKVYTVTLFFSECSAFVSLIAFGMVFLVLKQQYFLGIGITVVCIIYFSMCYVNEKLLTKLSNVRNNLYNFEWYNLSPKQRKLLLVPLNVDNLGIGFNALGLHDLTLDRFADVTKAAYSNCLVLKDIVTKSSISS